MPLRIVDVTCPPARKAPVNSKIAAMITACFIVNALEPTEVAIAFATSFAPIPQAINNPKLAANINNIVVCSIEFSLFSEH